MKLLLVQNDKMLFREMLKYFSSMGCSCVHVENFNAALELMAMEKYDSVVIDVGHNEEEGIELINQIKTFDAEMGILVVSTQKALSVRVLYLDSGVDDYLIKPFYIEELMARLRAVHRRRTFRLGNRICFGEFILDVDAQILHKNGLQIGITNKEYQLLLFFLKNKNRVLNKISIAEHIWGDHFNEADNFDAIYVHMQNLRKKLVSPDGKAYIKTVWGMGYKFCD